MKKSSKWALRILVIFIALIIFISFLPESEEQKATSDYKAPPETDPTKIMIENFLDDHPEFGNLQYIRTYESAWAKGIRKKILTNLGEYLLYIQEDEIVGVYELLDNNQRIRRFHKEK